MNTAMIGIFNWNSGERVNNRYGAFMLTKDSKNTIPHSIDMDAVLALVGKKVKVVATVLEARKSGHIGDLFLGISPTTPEVKETIELGVGTLNTYEEYGNQQFSLTPDDQREELWLDPRKLYRLHDQTVMISVEITDEPCHPAPQIEQKVGSNEVLGAGEVDGRSTMQVKHKSASEMSKIRGPVKVESLGRGMYEVSPDYPEFGQPMKKNK